MQHRGGAAAPKAHRFISPPAPGRSELKAKDLRERYISCSCCSSDHDEFSTARLTLEE
jgi:hypothetical protein